MKKDNIYCIYLVKESVWVSPNRSKTDKWQR